MNLEIGKEYITRSGLKVKIYDIAENKNYSVIAGVVKGNDIVPHTYTKEGSFCLNNIHDYDIVGEWQEPLDFDWSCLPPWTNEYIAMDENGNWYAFSEVPEKSTKTLTWRPGSNGDAILIPVNYAPKNFKGTWGKSLFKNPNII